MTVRCPVGPQRPPLTFPSGRVAAPFSAWTLCCCRMGVCAVFGCGVSICRGGGWGSLRRRVWQLLVAPLVLVYWRWRSPLLLSCLRAWSACGQPILPPAGAADPNARAVELTATFAASPGVLALLSLPPSCSASLPPPAPPHSLCDCQAGQEAGHQNLKGRLSQPKLELHPGGTEVGEGAAGVLPEGGAGGCGSECAPLPLPCLTPPPFSL